jgi:sec-independent protein translocase protein TatA
MGLSGISPMSLILILIIIIVLFGPSRLATIGKELGEAVRAFKEGLEGGSSNIEEKKHDQSE